MHRVQELVQKVVMVAERVRMDGLVVAEAAVVPLQPMIQ